ncbi:hypothetical protein CONCODRAFT_10979 [Conidiobolus coronatus NRRL 28638]|uniref:G-protein coupled receptors family 1 profile domain-containing protein n=1 Tax=Conidiobolus coronatus (strain ATCC 28846 / CBS 209.66 / NRRL 28638) TaxID=796925 RepID=A0A137NWK9_CONC2|nr:hypothetical protein CONCODRAFT_10979 [Conidiobolus coronatus NRRL 28638]|eukprot:KXN67041.1 hypothetical protein CONCODRAFT_10979 [Conidiobolus coronatus NRRL 28638]
MGPDYYKPGNTPCLIYSFVVNSSNRIEIYTVGFLALMRYLISCHGIELKARVWLISYGFVIAPILALYLFPLVTRDANPLPSQLICVPFLKPKPETFVLSVINPFIFIIPCWISTYCYFVIGIKAYKKLNLMRNEAVATNDTFLIKAIKKQKLNLIFQLVVVFTVFNFCFMPVYVTIILRITRGYKRSPIADAIMSELIEVSRSIDPIITLIFQPELNHEFKVFLTKLKANIKSFIKKLFK